MSNDPGDAPAAPENERRPVRTAESRLNLIPVDPHRVYASWFLAPPVLEDARRAAGEAAGEAGLTLRLERVGHAGDGDPGARVQDYSAGEGWNERFLSLDQAGGTIFGSLGVRDGAGGFQAWLSSVPVTLPEAPARAEEPPGGMASRSPEPERRATLPEPSPTPLADRAPLILPADETLGEPVEPVPGDEPLPGNEETEEETHGGPVHPVVSRPAPSTEAVLDEWAILQAVAGGRGTVEAAAGLAKAGLPDDLVRVIPSEAQEAPLAPSAGIDEATAAHWAIWVGQRAAADAALALAGNGPGPGGSASGGAAGFLPGVAPVNGSPRPADVEGNAETGSAVVAGTGGTATAAGGNAPSSFRLASQVVGGVDPAPLRLKATLVIQGRVGPGLGLRIGPDPVTVRGDGGFTLQYPLDPLSAPTALLLDLIARPEEAPGPSLDLLGRMPSGGAALTLHTTVEIEGELNDPSYASFLPHSLGVDAAGRFRASRSLDICGATLAAGSSVGTWVCNGASNQKW